MMSPTPSFVEEDQEDVLQYQFLMIPELARNKILDCLKHRPSDLLNLRAVCSTTRKWIVEYPGQEEAFQGLQIKIEEYGKHTLKKLMRLEMGIKITNFYFHIKYEDLSSWFQRIPCLGEFLEIHGPAIKKLKLLFFNCCIQDYEFRFFQKLTALEELDLQSGFYGAETNDNWGQIRPMRIPENLSNLKVLKLCNTVTRGESEEQDYMYIWSVINNCQNLDTLLLPQLDVTLRECEWWLQKIMEYIQKRKTNQPDKPNLRYINMKHFYYATWWGRRRFLREFGHPPSQQFNMFAELCGEFGVKLLNVNSNLLDMMWFDDDGSRTKMIVSLMNINNSAPRLQFLNLEKLWITSSEALDIGTPTFRSAWGNLKTLKMHCDCKGGRHAVTVANFLQNSGFLKNLKGLKKFKFVGCNINGCDAPGRKLHRLWKYVPSLEELWIEKCLHLGDDFMGNRDSQNRIDFLNLSHLKKLTLKMEACKNKLTDIGFREVFRHLKLKEFNLTSDAPLKNVTVKGIESLLDGEFSNSIENFPFNTWSLANTSSDELNEVKKKFKSV